MRSSSRILAALALSWMLTACGSSAGRAPAPTPEAAPDSAPPSATSSAGTTPRWTGVVPGPAGQATIPAGTALPGENLSANETAALQRATDEGRLPWRLHPGRVADAYVRGWLAWENLGAWSGWDDATITMTNPHTADVTDRTDGRMITVRLRQPERQGARGIWVVAAGVYDG
jgi:hypothetical protein